MGLFNWAVTKTGRMFGYSQLKDDTKFLLNIPKTYADEINNQVPESVDFNKLDKAVLEIRKQKYLRLSKISLILFVLFLVLVICQLFKGYFLAAIACLLLSAIPGLFVIKYHYYYTVIKSKKLMSIKEYFERFRVVMK